MYVICTAIISKQISVWLCYSYNGRAVGVGTELGSYQNGDRFVDDRNGNVKSRPPETDLEVSLSSIDSAT